MAKKIQRLEDVYKELTKEEHFSLMFKALEDMQACNSRNIYECIIIAMGGKYNSDYHTYKLPSTKAIKQTLASRF